ncbi:MAG: hypothetical protein AB1938_30120 [Myxococcota bacterium]
MKLERLFLLTAALFAGAAWACPVCGTSQEQGQGAYVFMTAVMSLLPLALLGGVVAWVVVRVRRADHEDDSGAPAPAATERRD